MTRTKRQRQALKINHNYHANLSNYNAQNVNKKSTHKNLSKLTLRTFEF